MPESKKPATQTARKKLPAAHKRTERTLQEERDILQALMDGAKYSHLVYLDRDLNFVQVNKTYAATCGYSPEQMIGKNHFALYPDPENEAIFRRVIDTGEPFEVFDNPFEFPDQPERGITYWDWTLTPVKDSKSRVIGLVFSLFETTDRKRAEEKILLQNAILDGINRIFREVLVCETEAELASTGMKVIEEVTGSAFGFIGEIGADGLLHDIGLSDPGWEACRMNDKTGRRVAPGNFEIHGLYGKVLQSGAFFTNAPAAHPASIGTPEGHPALTSFLGVPLLDNGKTVGIVALANRQGGYRQDDLRALESLANAFYQALERKRGEMMLREYHEKLEARVAKRTTELTEANTALKVLLKRREADRQEIGDSVVGNIKRLVEPCLEKIRAGNLDSEQRRYLDLAADNLNNILSPFAGAASLQSLMLTPAEIQVASMIKYGKSTKEIADLLHLSVNTINVHRRAIRKKLGIAGTKENLQFLLAATTPPAE